jgi:hypothetical protein
MVDEEMTARAYHEASHVITALKLNGAVEFATVRDFSPKYDAGVRVWLDGSTTSRQEAQMALAGIVGEAKYLDVDADDLDEARWHTDRKHAFDRANDVLRQRSKFAYVDERTMLIDELMIETEALVDEHWPTIAKVSTALRKRGRLDADDLDELLNHS